jgi:tetratricopeptide (TPR) repeat protein
VLEEGVAVLEGTGAARSRFPASGLHWLRGSIRLVRDDLDGALADFDRELEGSGRTLYAGEFSVAALNTRGFALMSAGRLQEAEEALHRSLAAHEEQARVHLGLAAVARCRQDADAAVAALARARDGIEQLRRGSRTVEAALMAAATLVVEQRLDGAAEMLDCFLTEAPPGAAGWSIPVDPLFKALAAVPTFRHVLRRLARRAE